MRDLLTILAALLIAALTAALSLPPLVDWTTQRSRIERLLSDAAGTTIATEGAIELRLLPSPRLKLERIRIGPDGVQSPTIAADFLRAEVALAPLLGGEIRIRDARVGRAEIRLPTAPGGTWRVPQRLLSDAVLRRRWAIEDLIVKRLLVTTSEPTTGRTDQVFGEDVAIQAQAPAGPWRFEGTSAGRPFQLATGELGADGTGAVKFAGGGGAELRLEIDGRLRLAPGPAGTLVPGLAGTVKLSRVAPPSGQAPSADLPIPFLANASVAWAGRAVDLDGVTLELGEGGAALRLSGTGRLTLDEPRLALTLEARRLDLDAALSGLQGRNASGARWQLPHPRQALPVDLSLKLDSLALGGEEWTGISGRATLANGRLAVHGWEMGGSAQARIAASGEFGFGFAEGGSGRVSIAARSGGRLGSMLDRLGLASPLRGWLDERPIDLSGDLVVAEPLVSLRNLRVGLGEATLTGALRYTAPDGVARPRFDAQLAIQGLDLLRAPPPAGLFAAARGVDLGLILDARNVGYGAARGAGRIAARIAVEGTSLRVDRLEIADLAGANGNVSGRIESDGTGRIEGRVTARRAAPLLDLAGSAWIGDLAGLIPAGVRDRDLDLSVAAARASLPDGSGSGLRLLLKGSLAGGPFEAETVSEGAGLRSLRARLATERLRSWTGGPDLPALARSARLSIGGAPLATGRFGVTFDGDLAGVRVRTRTPLAFQGGAVEEGSVELGTDDVAPLAALFGETRLATARAGAALVLTLSRAADRMRVGVAGRLAASEIEADLTGRSLADIGGSVRVDRLSLPWLASALALNGPAAGPGPIWPAARFGPAPVGGSQGRVSIKARSLEFNESLVGTDAAFDLAFTPEGFGVAGLGADLAGGRVDGEFTISRQGGLASLTGAGSVRDLGIPVLLGSAAPGGKLSASLRFGAAGESPAGLVSNLGGAGTFALSELAVPRSDPTGIQRAVSRVLRSDDALASGRVLAIASEELDRGPLAIETLSGPATLVGGALRVAPLRGDAEAAAWSGSLTIDLRTLTLDGRGALQAKTAPAGWTGDPPYLSLGLQGPVARPVRTLDVGPLVNGLAAVVLTRELDRIDTFEADQNERQRRNGQREMDRARRIAEEAARIAARSRELDERTQTERVAPDRPRPPEPTGDTTPSTPIERSLVPSPSVTPGG